MSFSDVLSLEGMCAIVMVGSLALIVRSLLTFSRQNAGIHPQLMEIEAEVAQLRSGMGGRKQRVEELAAVVSPLRERETRLRKYCDQLRDIELEYDRSVEKEAEDEAAERARRIQRRKLGGPQ